MACYHRISSPYDCRWMMRPKPLEVTRTSLTTCYTSMCDSSRRNTYSLNKTGSKTGLGAPGAHPEPRLRTYNACTAPRPVCLLSLLCACSGYCVPAQPSMCHNTSEPTVCLLSLLYATIQPSLLCACSTFYMPQYSRAYCVPAQPSICHNTADPTMCLLSLLCATIQLSLLCAFSGCCVPAQAAVCLLRLLYACSACCPPVTIHYTVLRYKVVSPSPPSYDTLSVL